MMLVRSDEEESALLSATEEKGLMTVLESCGVPRLWGEHAVMAADAVRGHAEWQ